MFKALMGGGRSSSAARSNASAKSSSRRRADSKASSTVSRKSSRGDDRDRGLGDLSAYPSSGSRNKRYASSAAGDSVASSYATADPGFPIESDRIIERTPRRPDIDDPDRSDRYRDTADRNGKGSRRRERIRSPSRERERTRPVRDDQSGDADDRDHNGTSSRPERRRTHSGDPYPAMPGPAPAVSFAADVMATPNHQFPGMTTTMPGPETTPTVYDPHVQQQFPGQFPAYVAEPYRPPNPAGEAADYYGDQGQSVAEQPGVRPQPPLVIPNSQAHLMSASPVDNPPPEPSSMGQVGAAAAYYDDEPGTQAPQPGNPASTLPPNPTIQTAGLAGPAGGVAAAYQTGHGSPGAEEFGSPHVPVGASPSTYVPAAAPTSQNPPYKPSHSHGTGAAVGAAAAGAAAGYFLGHQHSSSSPDHVSQYTMQNPDDVSLNGMGYTGPAMYPPHSNAPPYAAAGAAAAAGYAAHPSHPHHAAVYHGAPLPAGGLAFQHRQRGPLSKFIDFWRDPEGVGMYEDYTETIGVCKYCFEPGTTSRDAPRKHHYRSRRRSSDHYSGSRVDKLSRYASSEDESRRRRKSRNSWLPGMLTGYAVKSLFNNKDFDDSYSVRTGQVVNSSYDSESVSTRRSRTSRGVYRRSSRSRSRDRKSYHSQPDLQMSRNDEYRTRSRSRSRSSSRSKHTLRDAALGAAIGTAAMSVAKSRDRSRSRSPRKGKSRKSSSSDSSFVDISRPARKSVAGGFGSFFTASSDNRKKRRSKKRKGIFSFNNSSSSSVDNDLAFGTAYARKPTGKSKKGKKKDRGDVDAALLGLGAAATALAATSHRRGRRRGEILAGKDSRSGPSDYASSATNDEGWEDLDSADQSSSSVSSALAFGESGRFGGDDSSHSSDSSTSLWGWRWGSKQRKKGRKKSQKKDYLPAAAAVGAGALGAAALASGRHRDSRADSRDAGTSSTGSLQQVAPIPTSDPSRFETVNIASLPPEPAYVGPGAIPLQQPQPVTPVSQAVYTSQGESIHAYIAPAGPPIFDNAYGQPGYGPRATDPQWNITSFPGGPSDVSRPHRRSDSSPTPHTEPLAGVTSTSLKRHSTLKEQPSVQFDLTHEQEEKERRAARLERSKRDSDRYDGVQLIDRESERGGERASRRHDDREERQRRERDYDDNYDRDRKEKDSSSWIGAAAAGTIGAAAAAAVLSRTSNDDASESSQRRHDERRQKRRAERRRMTDDSSVGSFPMSDEIEERSYTKRERSPSRRSTYPEPARPKPTYENYAEFFAPEGLRYSPDTYAQREPTSMPTIIEAVPASERSQFVTEEPHPDYTNLPWPVPSLKITEPTPPQSLSGSVRDATSPIPHTPEVIPEDKELERETTGSRVSWGKHELHEYEVPSTSSDHDSLDREPISPKDASPIEEIPRSTESPRSKSAEKTFGTDIEFAATVAAATAAAGFDPSIITEDPVYHTRSSPPGSEKIDSWTEIVPHRDGPRGFVEGEVDTPQERFIESEPLYAEPVAVSPRDNEHESQPRPSIAQEVIAQLSQKQEPEAGERNLPQSSPEQDYSMPGGFEPGTSRGDVKDDSRSVVSAPMPGDFEDDSRRTHDFEMMDNASTPAAEEAAVEGKKKRRKRRSKRDSGDLMDDSVSITSSPARIGEAGDKGKRGEEKERNSGGFLSNLFGSRVSEPVESKKSSSDDGRVSREVQSEIGPRTSEESRRRRKERSSSRRSSGHGDRLDDEVAPEDTLAADKENINVESYKSSRQRREERRRQRHEGILDSDKGAEAEKDREISQDHDEQPLLEEAREMPMTVDDGDQEERQIPVSGEAIGPSSRVASPDLGQEQDGDEEDAGQRSRRSSILRSTESPTAVPLHFRRPPTSPGTTSATSPVSPSTGSPTQTRHRRPNSTEFKHSREIRPLWLVERHGVTKMEPPEDEPLPSLPSSKTSSANASVEDLTALPDEKSWEQVDLSHYVHGPRDLDLSSPRGHDSQYDILDSQQGTPTAAVFAHHHPPSRKDQLKYEFHSPSELLQDPSTYAELPPSPTLGALPSAEGSAVGVRDDLDLHDLPPLPSSRPSTPENQMISMEEVDDTTPTQAKITPTIHRSASPKERDLVEVATATAAGAGLASLVGAEVEKQEVPQVETTPEPLDKNISDAPASEFVPGDREVPESPASAVFVDAPSAVVADSGDESAFQTPVDAPLASPEDSGPTGEAIEQETTRELQPQVEFDAAAEETKPAEPTNDIGAQPEESTETSTSSKKKKKKDKKKKNKAAETVTQDVAAVDTSVEQAPTPSEEAPNTEAEPAAGDQPSEQLPAPELTTEVEEQPPTEPVDPVDPVEAIKTEDSSNVTEMDQPIPEPEVAETAADTTVSSKKAKRDKKKKKKSQGAAADEAMEPGPAETGVSPLETSPEEKPDNTEEQRVEDTPKSMDEFLTPTEERSKSPVLEDQSGEEIPSVQEVVEQAETEPMTREIPAVDNGLQASAEPAAAQETQEPVAVPVESGEIEPTVAEERTEEQTPTVLVEQQPETAVTSTEPKTDEIPHDEQSPATAQEPQVEAVQDIEASDKGLEAEPDQGAASTELLATSDQTDPSLDSAAQTQDPATASPEVDTSLSRKSSKKKKNKKKAGAELAESETTVASPSVPSSDATPTTEVEPTSTGEVDLKTKPEEPSENKEESTDPPQSEEPEIVPDAPAESIQEPAKEVNPDELVEEPTTKKKKKKKNRKSAASLAEPEGEPTSDPQPEHQPESQPEAGPAEDATATPPHDETSGELPQPAADIDAQASPEPATNETQQDPAAAEDVDTIPAVTDEEPTQQPVESPEANDGTPHVSEQVEHEAGETPSSGKKSKKKKKKGSVSSPVDESMASTESRSLDAAAEPTNDVSTEPESKPQAEPEAEPSTIDRQPEAEEEQGEKKPAESEAPAEPANVEEPAEPAVPMTAAQKKKAKKEKKKKRQSALLEETTVEQAAEEVPPESSEAPIEPETSDRAPTEEATPVAEPALEEAKDAAVTEAEPIEQEATVAPTEETEQPVPKEVTEEPVAEEPVAADAETEKGQDETPIVIEECEAKQESEPVSQPAEDEPKPQTVEPTVSDEPTTMSSEAQPEAPTQQDSETVQDSHEPTVTKDVPELPVEESPKTEAEAAPAEEEAQPAPSAKSKKDKKKKKKRQSLALEEEPPVNEATEAEPSETPMDPVEVSESKEVAGAVSTDKSEEATPEDIAKEAPQEPEPLVEEEPASEATSQDAPVPVGSEEQQQSEAVEEPQPVLSKKQAKKEKKKKRKSVSFATEEPEAQALESSEPAIEPTAPSQETSEEKPDDDPVQKGPDDSATTSAETFEPIEPTPTEGTEVSSDVPQEQEEQKTSTGIEESSAEPAQDIVTEEPGVITQDSDEQPTQAEADLSEETQPVEAVEQNAEESSKAEAQVETETVQEPTTPEAGAKGESEPASEQAPTEPETPVDTEPEATTPKSKKDKKKKKKKQKALELSEDVAPTPESQVEAPQPADESEKQVETTVTELNDAEGTADSGKPEETSQLTEEPRVEMTEEEPKVPETVDEPQQQAETQEEATAVSEAEPSAAREEPQPSVPEEEMQDETAKDDAMANMSAKERRKAKKKEKKRQSKNLDVETTEAAAPTPSDDKPRDETPAADDTTRDAPVEEAKPADEQSSLETAIAPAEDHGKDNQSHGTDMHADTDKDMIWTDEMVSSQVEQQQHQSLQEATSSESPLPPVRDVEGEVATPSDEIKAVDENVEESGVAGEAEGRDLPAEGAEEPNQDEARGMMEGGEEAVVREDEGADAPPEQTDEHVEREKRSEDVPSGGDTTESVAEAPQVTEEAVAQAETIEDQPEKEQAMGSEAAVPEPVTLSKKKSKKEKKKQRQAQKALASAEEEQSGETAKEISEPTANVEASESVPDQLEVPEEKASGTEETAPPASGETSGAIVGGSEQEAEPTVPPFEEKLEESAPVMEDEAPAEEPKEVVESEEPAKEMEATEVEAEPAKLPEQAVEVEQTNDGELAGVSNDVGEREPEPEPESVSGPLTEEKAPAEEDLDATIAKPSETQPEESSERVEEPTLSRKESKKKKKKAKKQAKEQEVSEPVIVSPAEEEVPAETESTQLKDSANVLEAPKGLVEEGPAESSEQPVEEKEPAVSLDPVEVPSEEDKDRGLTTEPAEQVVQATDDQEDLQQEGPKSEESQAQTLEKEDDLEMAGDLIEGPSTRPEVEVPVTRKLSKKEKRKAKQQAKLEAEEPAQEPAQEPEPETRTELVEEQQPQEAETLPAEESLAEDPLLSRKLSKKEKKKKRKGKSADESQTIEPPAEPTTQDEEGWPTIDWEKGQVDTIEKTPQSSPEAHHVTPFEPAITEYDESAIPEGVSRHADESSVDTARGDDIAQDEKEPVLETSVPDMAKEAPVEAREIPETTEKPVTEPVVEQFLHDVTASVPEKRRMDQADVLPHKQSKVASIFPHLERGLFKRPTSTESLRQGNDGAEDETVEHEVKRDSAIPVSEAPISTPSPEQVSTQTRKPEPQQLEESATPGSQEASSSIDAEALGITPLYAPTPIHDQTSTLVSTAPVQEVRQASPDSCELRRSPSIHGRHNHPPRSWSLEDETSLPPAKTPPPPPSLGPSATEASPPRTPLHTITEDEADGRVEETSGTRTMDEAHGTPRLEMRPEHVLPRPQTPVRKFTDNALDRQRWPTPDPANDGSGELEVKKRGLQRGLFGSAEVLKTPDQGMPILRPSSVGSIASSGGGGGGARSLRRTNRSTSGDLRAAATLAAGGSPQPPASPPQPTDLSVEHIPSSSSYDPLTDKGKRPLRSMTDVYEGWGETPSSPRSPSRPPSIRHRRSMQHLQELESRLDQLISENRLLIAARDAAEDKLRSASVARRKSDHALNNRDADLRDREAELEQLKNSVEWLQKEVSRLNQENEGLSTTNANLTAAHVAELQSVRESSSRELEVLRYENQQLSTDLHEKIRQQIDAALTQKNTELRRLREELEGARDKVKELQQQIAASMHDNVIVFRDEDYFDAACQKLCGHVQQWVLRFSKHSDHHRCRKLIDLQDEKIADRFDNAILDGSDADIYLADRVRRRDVFMSVVMTMVWEFIFTRYLFGMDREQRQKLKSLEKQLAEVGPRAAIHRWRATTLTLLAKRPAFARQRESDTEAVALEIFDTLSRILPPPSHVEAQLLESLRKVLRVAVNLSIEMRTQLAEYIMLPPLQPEYDTNGDLSRQVYFNASLMNERSGETTSNEELESQQAVVRVVLFPLVVKKGNDSGEGDDEVVVCPAQVLIARPGKDKKMSRILSSDRMSLDATKSVHSIAPSSTMDMSNVV